MWCHLALHPAAHGAVARNPAPDKLYPANKVGRDPEWDTFQYTTTLYPAGQQVYSCGQYVRARLSVSGYLGPLALGGLSDLTSLANQEGAWQWLNSSIDEAGLMLIKHFHNGDSINGGINLCNATAEHDVIAWTSDLSAASGERPVVAHSSVLEANVHCGLQDSACVRDHDAQLLDAFATFELPCGFDGPFRLCYRKSVSRFANDTELPGWWSPYQTADVVSEIGGPWGAPNTVYKHLWEEPHGDQTLYYLNGTSPVWYSWHSSRSTAGREGDWATIQVHADHDSPVQLSASSDRLSSDQAMLVPSGQPCIREASAPAYPGTVFSDAAGAWVDVAFDDELISWAASENGTFASRVGAVGSSSGERCPHRPADVSYSFSSTTAEDWYVLLFVLLPRAGAWDLCYSSKEDRALASALYTSGGTTYLDPRIQGAGGWRKLTRGGRSTFTSFEVGTADNSVQWSSGDTTAGTWGHIRIRGAALSSTAATKWDTGTGTAHSYESLEGGDQVRLAPWVDFEMTSPETPAGCWANTTGLETRWLLGAPWDSPGLWQPDGRPYGAPGTPTDGFFYLRFPERAWGLLAVCYRPAGGHWRVLDWDSVTSGVSGAAELSTAGETLNVTWWMNDTREGTWGPLMLQADAPLLNTQGYEWALSPVPAGEVALKLVGSAEQCQPSAADLMPGATPASPHRFVLDVGLTEPAVAADGFGRLDSSLYMLDSVAAWMTVPPASASYLVCLRVADRNWQLVSGQYGESVFTPSPHHGVRYELLDTRAATWGTFLLSAFSVSAAGHWGLPAGRLSAGDEFRLVPNTTEFRGDAGTPVPCDRNSLAPEGLRAEASAAFCSSSSSDPSSPCYTAWTRDQAGVNPLVPPVDFLAVYHFLTLPAPTWPMSYSVCYRQQGYNWAALPPLVATSDPHRIALAPGTPLKVPSATWHRIAFVFTDKQPPLLFDLRPGWDAVKLVAAGSRCTDLEVQNAISSDLLHPTNASAADASGQREAAAELPLPYIEDGLPLPVRVCYRNGRASGRNNWVMLPEELTVEPSHMRYSLAASLVYRGVVQIRFLSPGLFDTNPGRDAFKLVPWGAYCRAEVGLHQAMNANQGGGSLGGMTDLGPSDIKGTGTASATFALPASGGPYRVCYFHASGSRRWTHLTEEPDAGAVESFGLTFALAIAREAGQLQATSSGLLGIEAGLGLVSPEGVAAGRTSLVGGAEISVTGSSALQISIVGGRFFPGADAFKMARAASLEGGEWVPTGAGCEAPAEPGTSTTSINSSSTSTGWAVPLFTLPFSSGRFHLCYKWAGVGAGGVPTWIQVPVERLSYTYASGLAEPIAGDAVQVMQSELYYRVEPEPRVVVEDHFLRTGPYTHVAAPSLSATITAREDQSDWLRVIPSSANCQNLAVRSLGVGVNDTFTSILVYPVGASNTSFIERTAANMTLWPPSGLHKVCYRKLRGLDAAGRAVRAPALTWLVLPSAAGRAAAVAARPVGQLRWVGSSLLTPSAGNASVNVTAVGAPFTVRARLLDADGAPVPGRSLVALYDAKSACRSRADTCAGLGMAATSAQCPSAEQAAASGWPPNNTLQWTDEDGVAEFHVAWTEECSPCRMQAQVVYERLSSGGRPIREGGAATTVWFFTSTSAGVARVTTAPLADAEGYMEGAAVGSPLYLTADYEEEKEYYFFSLIGLSPGGARAYEQGTHVNVKAGVEPNTVGGLSLRRTDTGETVADADGSPTAWNWKSALGQKGETRFRLSLRPADGFVNSPGGADILFLAEVTAGGAVLASARWRLRVRPVVPARLQLLSITPASAEVLPPKWEAEGWPSPLAASGMRPLADPERAAPGYYLSTGHEYRASLAALDAVGRRAPAASLRGRSIAMTLRNASGADVTSQALARRGSALQGGLLRANFAVRWPFPLERQCLLRLALSGTTVAAEVLTPVRSRATRLAFASPPPLSAPAGALFGPFNISAVDDGGELDGWFNGWVWPLIEGGDGIRNDAGVGLADGSWRQGLGARQRMWRGRVQFDRLRIAAPCLSTAPAPCRINFLSDEGLLLLRTEPLNISDTADHLGGTVTGGHDNTWTPLSNTLVPVGVCVNVTLVVYDRLGGPTHWVNEWFIANQFRGAAPFQLEGGRAQRLERSRKELCLKFTAPCSDCRVRFTIYPRDGWWTASHTRGSWDTPAITVTDKASGTRLVLLGAPVRSPCGGERCELPLVPRAAEIEPADTGRPWYYVERGAQFAISMAAVDIFGAKSHPNSTQAKRTVRVTVTKNLGDDVLDGNGGAFTTDPLTVRQIGLQLAAAEGRFLVSFPRPCLQCLLTLEDADTNSQLLAPVQLLLTVLPEATAVHMVSDSGALRPMPYGGQRPPNSAVWLSPQFVLVDGDAIDYTQRQGVTVWFEPPPWADAARPQPLQQELLCGGGPGCSPALGHTVGRIIRPRGIVAQIHARQTGEVGPRADFVLAGRFPHRNGTLHASTATPAANDSAIAPYVEPKVTQWGGEHHPVFFRVLDVTEPDPPWEGYAAQEPGVEGYLGSVSFPAFNYTTGPLAVGTPWPLTVQIQDRNGTRVTGSRGIVRASLLVPDSGCGSGQPLTDAAGGAPVGRLIAGNLTLWLRFPTPCTRCVVRLDYEPTNGTAAPPLGERTQFTVPLSVSAPQFAAVVVEPNATHIPASVAVGEALSVTLHALGFTQRHPIPTPAAAPVAAVYNRVIPRQDGYGTADPSMRPWGNGGQLAPVDSPQQPAADGGVVAVFRNGVATVEFTFTRGCGECSLIVALPGLNTTFVLRTTDPGGQAGNTIIRVRPRGIVRKPRGRQPVEAWRGVPFAVTLWHVDRHGDRVRESTAAEEEGEGAVIHVTRENAGGNGDGGLLVHSNGALSHAERGWLEGAQVWRLHFTSSCFNCIIGFTGGWRLALQVHSPATRISVLSMHPPGGVLGVGELFRFELITIDDEGNRDYTVRQTAGVKLSRLATEVAPPLIAQYGDGGTPEYNTTLTDSTFEKGETMVLWFEKGICRVNIKWAVPVLRGFLHFFLSDRTGVHLDPAKNVTSAADPAKGIPDPPAVTVTADPVALRFLEHDRPDVVYEGNPVTFWIAVVDNSTPGWVASQASGFVDLIVQDGCVATNLSIAGSTRRRLVDGAVGVEVDFRGLPMSPTLAPPSVAPSAPPTVYTNVTVSPTRPPTGQATWPPSAHPSVAPTHAPTTRLGSNLTCSLRAQSQAAPNSTSDVHTVRLYPVVPEVIDFIGGPPTHAVRDRALAVAVAAFDRQGHRSVRASGWVGLSMQSCDAGSMVARNTSIGADGAGATELTFTGAGKCVVAVQLPANWPPWLHRVTGLKSFDVVVQQPVDVALAANITTDAAPVLRAGVAYPLVVRILDELGHVVRGDMDSHLSIELTRGPTNLTVRNMNASGVVDALPSGETSYGRKTEPVRVYRGEYRFLLAFSSSTGNAPARFQVAADFRAGAAPVLLGSELFEVSVAPSRLRVQPPPPVAWVTGRPFQATVQITDDRGNMPVPDGRVWRITWGLNVRGVEPVEQHFVPVPPMQVDTAWQPGEVITASTERSSYPFHLRWAGPDGAVEYKVATPGLAEAVHTTTFQTPAGIALAAAGGIEAGAVVPTLQLLSFGVVVQDAGGAIVAGDSASVVQVVYTGGATLVPTTMRKPVSGGRAVFDFRFSRGGSGCRFSFAVQSVESPETVWRVLSPTFAVQNLAGTPVPVDLLLYTPPRVSMEIAGTLSSFVPTAFAAAVAAAVAGATQGRVTLPAFDASNVNIIQVCPVGGNTSACQQLGAERQVLVALSAVGQRGVGPLGGGGRAAGALQGARLAVDFQMVLRPEQGLVGGYESAMAVSFDAVTLLSAALQDESSALRLTYQASPDITVTDLQPSPTPSPPRALPTPQPTEYALTPADKDLIPNVDPPQGLSISTSANGLHARVAAGVAAAACSLLLSG